MFVFTRCMQVSEEARKGCWVTWNWHYRWFVSRHVGVGN